MAVKTTLTIPKVMTTYGLAIEDFGPSFFAILETSEAAPSACPQGPIGPLSLGSSTL
jgi:hypothetical protein